MARRKNRNKVEHRTPNLDSTIKQIHAQLLDPHTLQWVTSGAKGVREKILSINFNTLRRVVDKVPLIGAIINTRVDQVLPFCQFQLEEGDPGFRIVAVEGETPDDSEVRQLAEFIEQTGFLYDEFREDDFMDYMQMLVRETLTIDQIATEIQVNRRGDPIAFWGLDGATIKRVHDGELFDKGVRFVQEIDNRVYAHFSNDNLIFDYKNKRADIRYRGFGYSGVEQAIDIITTLLFGYNYLQDQLVRDRMPKGFISIMGDASREELDSVRNYWYAAMSGAGGRWNIPILPSGKDGIGIDFKSLNQSNHDMEYHKLLLFVSGIVSAVFSMDLAEMGLKSDDSQSVIHTENAEPRIRQSKNRGLKSILMFSEQHMNKVLRKVTTKYRFKFTGIESEDLSLKEELYSKQLQSRRTVNEIREEAGDEPIDEDWANVVLNPQAVQIYLNGKQQEQAEAMQNQMGGQGGFDEGFGGLGFEEEAGPELVKSDLRKLTHMQERVVRHVID